MEELICVARNTDARVRGICGMSVNSHPDTSRWPDDRHEVVPGIWFSMEEVESTPGPLVRFIRRITGRE